MDEMVEVICSQSGRYVWGNQYSVALPGIKAGDFYSQTKQKIPNKACSKDKQPDITFLRCRLIFAH
ncbi:MAG: hypothetical protein KIC74_02310, partial [Neisseria sp.]|nr:hypothetical protein [Neisseria sp.]